uniref:Uncharacterized protein n=1 Tax=Lactuca sativa TaxID=4236 RepID=A0A9R1W733_LACSA|nr:hypothetical protein LSAT_V11C300140630 [Lactuca sativa]
MDEDEDVYPQFPNIFNEKLHWKEQVKQFKHMLCNYVVANCYQLCFVKNDGRRLLAKCCDGNVHLSEHNCSKNFKFGLSVTYTRIGTQFTQQFFNNQKISMRLQKRR